MKKVECIIKPERIEELKKKLLSVGVGGMTITDVRGFGKEVARPDSYLVLPKIKVEVYCTDEQHETIIEAMIEVCRRNELGDGKIAVINLEDMIRIRTGERKAAAVY
jgi:nitrogen regulatory protein P-II 1